MPYPEEHHKFTVYGDCYNATEKWSLGWRMRTVQTDAAGDQARAALAAPIVSAWWSLAGTAAFNATHRLQGLKVARIQQNGLYPEDSPAGEVFFANIPGPSAVAGTSMYLPQGAICVSLLTAKPRGLASKGRLYLPPMNYTIIGDGMMPDAFRDALVTKMKNFFTDLNAMEAGDANVAIFSRGKGVKSYNATTKKIEWDYPNPGQFQPVTRVEVGRVVDTQRRRRRQLVEQREGLPLG